MSKPFDYLNSINTNKNNLMRDTYNDDLAEKDYKPFLINRGLSYFQDTIMFANEMNFHSDLDNKLQYEFLLNIVRPRKRFSKWIKKEEDADLEAIKEYYAFGDQKAVQALSVLSEKDIEKIKTRLEKGGT